ncbi:alanine/glycine:cation symporter family protein [Arthrobacter rhombi]|uniref:alanine/glycine:cation symporter family protein n=1 Tax=Arthrobacter rhombi TaxID=71253 RepID=UPI003FD40B1A
MNLPLNAVPVAASIDETLENAIGPAVEWLENIVFASFPFFGTELPFLIIWLLAGGIFLTVLLKFQPIIGMRHMIQIARGRFNRFSDPGETTSFQALATELSGTVGLGNIAGVAVAITIGGPGATLWIIIAGFLGMSLKMAEATLGVMFRRMNKDGTVSGGPMYYLETGLAHIGKPKTGRVLAMLYALLMIFGAMGAGNIFQANQVTAQLTAATGGESSFLDGRGWIVGVVLAVVAAAVIFGGIRSIARWTSKLTPIMAVVYGLSVIVILIANISELPQAIVLIFEGAFTGNGVAGGAVGVAIVGIQRALFSNAAGVGSAGIAHSTVKTKRPAQEGYVASVEPFIDSVIICTMTALAIIVTGQYAETSADGVGLTSVAFGTVAAFFPYILTLCVLLFAFSTLLSYSYYGKKAAGYVFGNSKRVERIYDGAWIVMIVVGSSVSLDTVVAFSDATFFLLTVPNILGIYLLSGVLRREILGHRADLDAGRIPEVAEHERSTVANIDQKA